MVERRAWWRSIAEYALPATTCLMAFGSIFAAAWVVRAEAHRLAAGRADWIGVIGMVAAGVIAILLHEAGHWLAALKLGWQPTVFAVGPLRIWRRRARTEVKLHWRWTFNFGFVLCHPNLETAPASSVRQFVAILLAGPFWSLVLGVVAVAVGWKVGVTSVIGRHVFWFGVTSWAIGWGTATVFPNRPGFPLTDGSNARNIHRVAIRETDIERREDAARMIHIAQRLFFEPLARWGAELDTIRNPQQLCPEHLARYHVIRAWLALSAGHASNARVSAERAIEALASAPRTVTVASLEVCARACQALVLAAWENDPVAARALLDGLPKTVRLVPDGRLARLAIDAAPLGHADRDGARRVLEHWDRTELVPIDWSVYALTVARIDGRTPRTASDHPAPSSEAKESQSEMVPSEEHPFGGTSS